MFMPQCTSQLGSSAQRAATAVLHAASTADHLDGAAAHRAVAGNARAARTNTFIADFSNVTRFGIAYRYSILDKRVHETCRAADQTR